MNNGYTYHTSDSDVGHSAKTKAKGPLPHSLPQRLCDLSGVVEEDLYLYGEPMHLTGCIRNVGSELIMGTKYRNARAGQLHPAQG